jgi:integrase
MSATTRHKTKYPGVFFRYSEEGATGETEKVYYAVFKRNGRVVEAKIGGQFRHGMTPAKAAGIRAEYVTGKRLTPQEQRAKDQADKQAEEEKPTLARLWEAFREAKQGNKSVRDDVYRWKKHLEPVFAKKTPAEILTLDVDRLRVRLLKSGLAPETVKHVLVLLKRIISHAVRHGLPPVSPSRLHFEMPTVNNQTTEDLNPEELARLLEAISNAKDWRAAGLLRLAMLTGMRRGELLSLQWQHIDLARGFVRIVGPKGGKDASIPLNDAARRVLAELPRPGSDFLFPGRTGRACDLKKPIAAIKKAAGLPADFRPVHGLRHFFATTLASSGEVDLHTLQRLLNHKSPQMTQRYSHLRDDALQRASGVMASYLEDVG